MGSFVSLYNYLGFRLGQAPFELSHAAIGAIFLLYVVGMVSSPWAGRRADRHGSSPVLARMLALMAVGLALTAADRLPLVVAGVALFTFGFFGAHAVASAWVGHLAKRARSLASATYLTAYYFGASTMGWLGGHAWSARPLARHPRLPRPPLGRLCPHRLALGATWGPSGQALEAGVAFVAAGSLRVEDRGRGIRQPGVRRCRARSVPR
jgi:MFS family permease